MKIIIYSNSEWNLFNFRSSLIDILHKNYDVLIVCKKLGKNNYFKRYHPQLSLIEVNSKNLLLGFFEELFKFFCILKNNKPNVVLSFTHKSNITNIISSLFFKSHSISVITGLGSFFLEKKYFFLNYIIKLLYSFSDKIIFQNKFDKILFNVKNSYLISGSGIDLKKFMPKKKFNHKKLNFFLISRIIKDKGIEEYFLASKFFKNKNKNLKFNFVGDFSEDNPSRLTKKEFKKLIKYSNVKCHPYKKDVNYYLNKTDCLVLPSYREGLSKITLEAMSKGIPVLGSKVPGIQDIIKHSFNGYLFKPRNTKSLINMLRKFIFTPFFVRKKFGKRSIHLIKKNYSNKIVIAKYLKIIEKLKKP